PESLKKVTTHFAWRAPTFRRTQHYHRPAWPLRNAAGPTFLLIRTYLCNAVFHRSCHRLVHALRVASLNEMWRPAITSQQAFQLFVADTRQKSRIIDLVAVQVKDGQDRSIPNRIQELADVPRCG